MVVLVVGLGYIGYSLFAHSGADYLSVSEMKSQADSTMGQQVRVLGRVVPGSIDWDDKGKTIRFTLADGNESLNIVYTGIVPDSFKPGNELVAVGQYHPDDVLEAVSLASPRSFCAACH